MAVRVCVGNRQGGVGKSTITMMLAHALAVIGKKRVLVIDLDPQCNSSFALIGSARWRKAVEDSSTLSDYMGRLMRGRAVRPREFILQNVGDVSAGGASTNVDLMPSAIELDEDIQEAIIDTHLADPFNAMNFYVRNLLSDLDEAYEYILMDCPPGISPLVNAAVFLGHRVVVPFRPDYISQFALDRMADKVERTGRRGRTNRRLESIPHANRRYVSVVNLFGGTAAEKRMLADYEGVHPRLKTEIKRQTEIADAFYWHQDPGSLREKYGKAEPQVKQLYGDFIGWLEASQPGAPAPLPGANGDARQAASRT